MSSELYNLIQKKNKEIQPFHFAFFANRIMIERPKHVMGIMAYGSTLNDTTKSSTSTPDFYVIVENYKDFYATPRDRFLNNHLPPSIYHINTPQGSCKYCVISIRHLEKEVSEKAKDVYHLGRFSKRMGLIYAVDDVAEKQIVQTQVNAILSVSKRVLQSLDASFTLDHFIERSLYLSYQGDVRIESTDKVRKIMESEKAYYEQAFRIALKDLGIPQNPEGQYILQKSALQKKLDHLRFDRFINQSRVRARMRWPKNMFTVSNWLDYMLAKIERTQEVKIEMTPTEKKFWYIFGWKHFIRLYRKKLIK